MNIFNFCCSEDDLRRVELLLHKSNELAEESNRIALAQLHVLTKLEHCCRIPHIRTGSINVIFNTEGELTMADLSLQVGQSSVGTVTPFLADGTTQTPGAVVSHQVWTLSDPAITVTNNPDGTITVAGVSATTGAISGSVSATVTDSDAFVQTLNATFTVTVGGVAPGNRTASIGVSWSSPS